MRRRFGDSTHQKVLGKELPLHGVVACGALVDQFQAGIGRASVKAVKAVKALDPDIAKRASKPIISYQYNSYLRPSLLG